MAIFFSPRTAFSLFCLALVQHVAHGHLVQVCTSTDPSAPGDLVFWLGHYHQANEAWWTTHSNVPPGQISISNNDIGTISANFENMVHIRVASQSMTMTPGDVKTELMHSLPSIVKSTTTVTCWVNEGTSHLPNTATWAVPVGASTNSVCHNNVKKVTSYNYVTVQHARSGSFQLATSGTDQTLDPLTSLSGYSGVDKICGLSGSQPVSLYSLTIATGGLPCTTAVPANGNAGHDQASIDACSGAVTSRDAGYMCPATCQGILLTNGEIKCQDDGTWLNTLFCSSTVTTNSPVTSTPTTVSPTTLPTAVPSAGPITAGPTLVATKQPTVSPSGSPSANPTAVAPSTTVVATKAPSAAAPTTSSASPTTGAPTNAPTSTTEAPTAAPSAGPTTGAPTYTTRTPTGAPFKKVRKKIQILSAAQSNSVVSSGALVTAAVLAVALWG